MTVAHPLRRAHERENGTPEQHVGEIAPAPGQRPVRCRPFEDAETRRPREPVQQLNREVQHRHLQQLVVERGYAGPRQQRVQRQGADTVERPEHEAPHLCPRRRGRIGEQEVHAQKHGNRDIRVVKEIDAGGGEIEETEHVGDHDRGHRHRRHAEEILPGQRDEKQRQVDVRGEELGGCDVLPPGEVARAGENQRQREDGERKRRRIENMDASSLLVPADQLLGREPEPHQQKLQIEPVVREPEKQVDAEDDGERTEPREVRVAA